MKYLRKSRIKAWFLLTLFLTCGLNGSVNALTQQDLYTLNIPYFDIKEDNCSASASAQPASLLGSNSETKAQQIASTFIVGLSVNTPKDVITGLASKYHIGGMYVLDTKDAAGAGFNKTFYDSLNAAANKTLVIASDEEGGAVTRYSYPDGFPSAAELAQKPNDQITAAVKSASGVMSTNGLNTDLAPVLDLRDVGAAGRSFSSDPSVVIDKAGAWTEGLKANNVRPIFKHFPGFDSSTSGNTDTEKVVMKSPIDEVVKPYKELVAKYPAGGVMLSNLYVNQFDENNPASLSTAAVQYLRNQLKFNGMITTDDLGVSSVTTKAGSLADAVSDALQAGVNMPLFTIKDSSTQAAAENTLDQIIAKVQNNSAAMTNVTSSQKVIKGFLNGTASSPNNKSTSAGCCNTSGAAGGSAVISGGDNPEITWNYFKGRGLDDMHVAAIMGNIQQESGFMPQRVQGSGIQLSPDPASAGSGGWGMAQWTPGSKIFATREFLKTAKTKDDKPIVDQLPNINGEITDIATQLDIIWGEMNTRTPTYYKYGEFLTDFLAQTDIRGATVFYQTNYEGPNPSEAGPRTDFANAVLKKYGTGGSGGGTAQAASFAAGSGGGCTQSQSPECNSAQGTAKILCAAKAYDSVSYVWGGAHESAKSWLDGCKTIGPSCGLDCSGLVNIAVYLAFGVDLQENTASERSDTTHWQRINSLSEVQPGDIMQPHSGHVEIVDHISGDTVYTFGAHTDGVAQPDQVGPSKYQYTSEMLFMRFKTDSVTKMI